MIALQENFTRLNRDRAVTVKLINIAGIKLVAELVVYRDHLVIPTVTPDQSLFGFKVITVINGEEIEEIEEIEDLDNPEFTPQESLEAAISTAKAMIDTFFSGKEA